MSASLSFSSKPLEAQQTATYVGPEECSKCHGNIYATWDVSLHSKMIRELTVELLAEYGLSEQDLAAHGITIGPSFPYTIGGEWKIRFINATADPADPSKWTVAVWQYTIATGKWEPYHPEAPKDWGASCAQCHVTGFDSATETFWGTIDQLATSITCESCHGAGGDHITNPAQYKMVVDVSAQVCGQCHIRGTFPEYELGNPASFSYTPGEKPHKHHQQFRDWNISAHSRSMEFPPTLPHWRDTCLNCHSADNIFNTDLVTLLDVKYTVENAANPVTCVSCHSPHELGLRISHDYSPMYGSAGDKATEYTVCAQCHTGGARAEEAVKEEWHHTQAELFYGSVHYASGVTCTSCHMPLDAKSAVKYDIHNHTMVVKSYDTYEYSCGQCHKEQLEKWPEWADQRIEEIQATVGGAAEKTEGAVASAEAAITAASETAGVDKTAIENAAELLLNAKSYLSFVEADASVGFHNPTYALSLLNTALDYARQAESAALEARAEVLGTSVTELEGIKAELEGKVAGLESRVTELERSVAELALTPYLYLGGGIVLGLAIGALVMYAIRRKP
ncbi:MAG: ammonia-forming cytochrome c nitrite reductase subunit c552 [Candidatus Bathyarchaeia archaeon]